MQRLVRLAYILTWSCIGISIIADLMSQTQGVCSAGLERLESDKSEKEVHLCIQLGSILGWCVCVSPVLASLTTLPLSSV